MDEDVPQCAALGKLNLEMRKKKGAWGALVFWMQRSYLVSIFCTLAFTRSCAM